MLQYRELSDLKKQDEEKGKKEKNVGKKNFPKKIAYLIERALQILRKEFYKTEIG